MTASDWGPDSPADDKPARVRPNTCSGCLSTWTGLSVAHCGGCHETFATVGLFDAHRVDGHCVHPFEVRTRGGEPRLFFRDGMWRGPELTDEQRAKLATVWGGESGDPIPA